MNFRPPLGFQGPPYPQQAPQKSNLEVIMESMLLAQQKQDEYIKKLACKVDMLAAHNKMLEAQIAQQVTSSPTPSGRLPSKPEPNPCEQCNCLTLRGGVEDSMGIVL